MANLCVVFHNDVMWDFTCILIDITNTVYILFYMKSHFTVLSL